MDVFILAVLMISNVKLMIVSIYPVFSFFFDNFFFICLLVWLFSHGIKIVFKHCWDPNRY